MMKIASINAQRDFSLVSVSSIPNVTMSDGKILFLHASVSLKKNQWDSVPKALDY